MVKTNTFFISDLHLSEERPETVECFIEFLKNVAEEAKALYILGDFFEIWVGDDDRSNFNERIKATLRQWTDRGIPTYFMHGNRDFLIQKRFAKETGVILLKEPTTIELNGERILLLHGDSLCTLDTRHQKSRKIYSNRFYQKLAMCLPLKIRQHYGRRLRSNSTDRKQHMHKSIMDVTPDEVRRVMIKAQVKTLIHGHTHRPAIHHFFIDNNEVKRIVLGDWHHTATYLRVTDEGVFELV